MVNNHFAGYFPHNFRLSFLIFIIINILSISMQLPIIAVGVALYPFPGTNDGELPLEAVSHHHLSFIIIMHVPA